MVEDYVPPNVIEFDVSTKDKQIKADAPVELKVDGHFLYGAPASGLPSSKARCWWRRPSGTAGGFCAGYQFGVADEETASKPTHAGSKKTLPEADANGVATFPGQFWAKNPPSSTRSAGSPDLHSHGGSRRPRGGSEAQTGAAGSSLQRR